MEIQKQLRIKSVDFKCEFNAKSSSFHLRVPGLTERLGRKKLLVKISDVELPCVEKTVSFHIFYGKMSLNGIPTRLNDVNLEECVITYVSMEDLAYQVMYFANRMVSSDCGAKENHEKHVCTNIPQKKSFKLVYENGRFMMWNGSNMMVVFCGKMAELLGFNNCCLDEVYTNGNVNINVVRIESNMSFGERVSFFDENNRFYHILYEGVIPHTSASGQNYPVLFSYNNEKKSAIQDDVYKGVICRSDILYFSIVCDKFMPVDLGERVKTISFTMLFC